MKRRTFLEMGTGAVLGSMLTACGGSSSGSRSAAPPPAIAPVAPVAPSNVVLGWNQAALQAIRNAKPGPPMAARSLAILHTSMYDAWAAYDATALATPPARMARRPPAEQTAANKAAAMSQAAYVALADQFPTQKALFDVYLASLGYQSGADATTPAGVGAAVAAAMLGACHDDGANQLGKLTAGGAAYADYTGYVPQNPPLAVGEPTPLSAFVAPGRWQPLSFVDASGVLQTQKYVAACWDHVTPFALAAASVFRPAPPAAFGSADYLAQVQRIVDVTAALTDEQKVIAEYWADGPSSELPPGHWCLFAQYVSRRDGHGDDDDVKLFFALANALSDAAIAAWDAKRAYDSVRPLSAVRQAMHGQTIVGYGLRGPAGGLGPIAGETWMPYQSPTGPTPAFPEHVSGHSSFSAAAAEVLRRFKGSDAFGASFTRPAGAMLLEPGMPRADVTLHWGTFSDAAEQAGMSRIYGGIHFDAANSAGKEIGRQVGAAVFDRAQGYWQGRG